jgi:hypothetical protein
MADIITDLLPDIELYLNITWKDDATDKKITGYINRGMKRLQNIAGASLNFNAEDMPRALLFDYCRYANSPALEVFEKNFEAELLDLNLRTQAPIIDGLVVLLGMKEANGYQLTVSPAADEGNKYLYQVGVSLAQPDRMDSCMPPQFTEWDGITIIPAQSGQDILVVEINDEYKAVRAGKVTVSA